MQQHYIISKNKHLALFQLKLPTESGLSIKGDARKIITIEVSGKQYLVAAVNDRELQVFRLLR